MAPKRAPSQRVATGMPKATAKAPKATVKAPARAASQKRHSAGVGSPQPERPSPPARSWPPKVPLGHFDDILPLIQADDESIDSLVLQALPLSLDGVAEFAPQSGAFGPEDVEYVCECLRKNTTVTRLCCSFNNIGDVGAAHVGRLISEDRELKRLELNSCGIGSAGAKALAEALTNNKSVEVVELANNSIDDDGGAVLLEMLKCNTRLRHLSLSFNHLSEQLEREFEKMLRVR